MTEYCTVTEEQMGEIVEHLAEFIRRSNSLGGQNNDAERVLQIAKASLDAATVNNRLVQAETAIRALQERVNDLDSRTRGSILIGG